MVRYIVFVLIIFLLFLTDATGILFYSDRLSIYADDLVQNFNNKRDVPLSSEPKVQKKLIILSIDGFPGYYLDSTQIMDRIPNLRNLFSQSQGGRVKTVNPSLTYPSHTSMITGVDPGLHGIEGNRPIDPFGKENGAWMWYLEDRKVPSVVEYAKKSQLTTASVYWPVSVGEFTDWNIPQIWRAQTTDDEKLLRALSTPGLYREMQDLTGETVSEITDDKAKILTGIRIFKEKNPDLTLIYSTDVDTNHHKKGMYSKEAIVALESVDRYVGELIKETNLYNRDDLGLIIVSDHGFLTATKICRPNKLLLEMGYIRPKSKSWDFYFQSSAGMAALMANPTTRKGRRKFPGLVNLKKKVESICPGVKLERDGKVFRDRKKNSHPRMQALLSTNRSIYISATSSGAHFENDDGLHVHGFPAEWEEMDAVLYFYARGNKEDFSISSVKDVYTVSCKWLDLRCKMKK